MAQATDNPAVIKKILVATDRSETADRAVRWAADMAASHQADLIVLQVLIPPEGDAEAAALEEMRDQAEVTLAAFAQSLAASRGHAHVAIDDDPAAAILEAVDKEEVDVVVVGNVGMGGRRQFLLGNIPNRVSHNARCTVIIYNSASREQAASGYRTAAPGAAGEQQEGKLLARAWRIGRVLVRAGARELMSQGKPASEEDTSSRARRFREALDELGPTFAKLGQILSTRPDLLPPAFIEELKSLQERVTPLTEAEVVAAMERELRVPWEDVFASIDPQPLAAGTIAQVHRATLETGERVVVKVQRPTAEEDILQDVALLEMFAAKASERPAFRRVFDVPAMVEHLSSSLRKELDFRTEAANINRMREVLSSFPRLDVPRVYEDYSTSRLLVMEEVQGSPVSEAPPGTAREEAARQLLESYYRQVLIEGFFHADPHPGNMKWWNDKIYLLDLGMVGEIDDKTRESILLLLLAFSQKDAPFLADVVLTLAGGSTSFDEGAMVSFRADLDRLILKYRDLSLQEIQLGPMLQEVTQISVNNNVRVPASLMLAGKAFAQMQMVASELDPTLDPFSVAESFLLRSTVGQLAGVLDPRKLFYEGRKAQARAVRLMESFESLMGVRPGGGLQVNFRGMERLEGAINDGSRRLSVGLGLLGAILGTTMTVNADKVPRWIPAALGGLGSLLAARLLLDVSRRPNPDR
ncbi:MAG TPA: AarF/UbiB family protein [Dehalococcoidia bacterium]|nr:AarF/UbiB family protein [Dehalococcoidia bacterium]